MSAPDMPEAHTQPTVPVEKIRTALTGYRVMAWTTGIWLIALCYEIVMKYVVKVDNPPSWPVLSVPTCVVVNAATCVVVNALT